MKSTYTQPTTVTIQLSMAGFIAQSAYAPTIAEDNDTEFTSF